MILLDLSTPKLVYMTLNELSVSGDYFLLVVRNEQDNMVSNTIITPLDENTRYAVFNLDPDAVGMDRTGFYDYKVYRQDSAVNLDFQLANGLAEQGRAFVKGTSTLAVFDNDGIDEIKTFRG